MHPLVSRARQGAKQHALTRCAVPAGNAVPGYNWANNGNNNGGSNVGSSNGNVNGNSNTGSSNGNSNGNANTGSGNGNGNGVGNGARCGVHACPLMLPPESLPSGSPKLCESCVHRVNTGSTQSLV